MIFSDFRALASANICTIQRKRVIDRFEYNKTHFQLLEHTAPEDQELDEDHRKMRAITDAWMNSQFERRLGSRPGGPLIWGFLDEKHVRKNLDCARKHDDEYLVHLCVPVQKLLLSKRAAWQLLLMEVEGDPFDVALGEQRRINSPAEIPNKWEAETFDISDADETRRLQAVVDRIEPEWFKSAERLGPQ